MPNSNNVFDHSSDQLFISFKELEAVLHELPSNIFFKDVEGRYIFASHYWRHIEHDDDPNWTIRGKTDMDIRIDKDNAALAMAEDRRIIETGKGTKYVITFDKDEILEYLQIIKEPVHDDEGNIIGIVGLINNVTEQEILRRKLKQASIVDSMTSLYNHAETMRRVAQELENASTEKGEKAAPRFALILVDIDDFKDVNDSFGHQAGDRIIHGLAKVLKTVEKASDFEFFAGRLGGDEFMVGVPDTSAGEARVLAESIRADFESMDFSPLPSQTISVGVAIASPEDDSITIFSKVDEALYLAKQNGKNNVGML